MLKNKGVTAILVKGVFNKKFQICSNILRSYMICCVYVYMYGYGMVCISIHEYLLAPNKVWTVPQNEAIIVSRRSSVTNNVLSNFEIIVLSIVAGNAQGNINSNIVTMFVSNVLSNVLIMFSCP